MRRPSVAELLGLDLEPSPRDSEDASITERISETVDTVGEEFGGDTAHGFLFAEDHRGKLIHVSEWKQWFAFRRYRWEPVDPGALMQAWASSRLKTAIDREVRRGTQADAIRVRTATKLYEDMRKQMLALAGAAKLPAVSLSANELDADPWSLGVKNGVVNLRTGKRMDARPEQRITKQAGCEFNPDAEAPRFMAFLEQVQPDPAVRDLLQRMAGYALIGIVDEEVLFFLHGPGASGKSTFANVMEAAFGDYAITSSKALLVHTHHTSETDRQVYQLRGARLASINETAKGDVFDDQKVKAITSRERISTRKLHAEAFSFMPTHTTILRGNFLPGVQDAGDGFWRRLVPIEFGVQIAKADRVPDLDRQIIAGELPGVLAWMVRGALEWQARGLAIPKAITKAAESYRESTDLFGQWLAECVQRDPAAKTTTSDLFDSYSRFANESGVTAGHVRGFSDELVRRGFHRDNNRAHGRRMVGLRLIKRGHFHAE